MSRGDTASIITVMTNRMEKKTSHIRANNGVTLFPPKTRRVSVPARFADVNEN